MNDSIKILFFTGNRSEFGLLLPIIERVKNDIKMDYKLIVSGSHISDNYGNTIKEIENNNINIDYKLDIKVNGDNKVGVIKESSELLDKSGEIINKEDPDYLFVLGDRYESFAVALSAFYLGIPIAHSGGGNITKGGAMDDIIRHSISKLASLHFTTCQENANNIKKLGEEEWRIFISGSPSVETVKEKELYSKKELENDLEINLDKPTIVFTQHPISSKSDKAREQVKKSLKALKELEFQTIITYPNQDPGSSEIIDEYEKWKEVPHFRFRKNLGQKRYFSLLNYASVVVGNSSSGLLETPIFKIPAVNIGSRQKGRKRSTNVIDVDYNSDEIKSAINKAIFDSDFLKEVKNCKNPFGNGNTSSIIIRQLKKFYNDPKLTRKELV